MRILTTLLFCFLAVPVAAVPVDHVILISVDGLRTDLLSDLLANDTVGNYANFQRLVDEGTATFNARTDYTHTVTLPNHTCMVTGRPVLQPAGQANTVYHGYTSKSKFIIFDQSFDASNGAPDLTGPTNGRDKIDTYYQASSGFPANAGLMQVALMSQLAVVPPAPAFVHYRDPDSAGHAYGWGRTAWNTAVQAVDGYLGQLLDFIAVNPQLMGRTTVIVTTDHGGFGNTHTVPSDVRDYTIPFFVWDTEVTAGADLYALNAGHRLDPGTGRPDYNAPVAPIRNGGAGNLTLVLVGLPAIAGSTINAAQDLAVSAPVSSVPVTDGHNLIAASSFPNPFKGRAVVAYELRQGGLVRLSIVDASGRLVRRLAAGQRDRGSHQAYWDGRDTAGRAVASGVYFTA